MFQISFVYTLVAYIAIVLMYIYMEHYHSDRKGFSAIFANTLFQMNRSLQIYLQNKRKEPQLVFQQPRKKSGVPVRYAFPETRLGVILL